MRCRRRRWRAGPAGERADVDGAARRCCSPWAAVVALAVLVGWLGFRAYQSDGRAHAAKSFSSGGQAGRAEPDHHRLAEGRRRRAAHPGRCHGTVPRRLAKRHGYRGTVAETVAINPALAISGVELINQWYYNPAYFAIMADCANTQIGVWSENSLDRTVVVAVYGQPEVPVETAQLGPEIGLPPRSGPRREFCARSQPGLRRQRRDRVRHRLVPLDPAGCLPAAGLSAELAAAV